MDKDSMQLSFNEENSQADNGPVVCLGMTFKNDEERREYFREELRKKLPELKKIEGFPIGEDEDIIALSDPPYYTACPNPWINDFIEEWEKEKVTKYGRDLEKEEYRREPFAADVSEGKSDKIYKLHSYHTKVPHKAIMRYILHYTEPNDIVFDAFSGTGMTGVAAQMCGNEKEIKSLGYTVKEDGGIYDSNGNLISSIGKRSVILTDLSTAATLITNGYNHLSYYNDDFKKEALRIFNEVKLETEWMFFTNHKGNVNSEKGSINYVIWSDVFNCPNCGDTLIYWDLAVDEKNKQILKTYSCPSCEVQLKKTDLDRVWLSKYDVSLGKSIRQAKQVPVLINYTYKKRRYNKKPDEDDLLLLQKIEETEINYWHPVNELPEGYNTSQPIKSHGFTNVHHFFTRRNYIVLASFMDKARKSKYYAFFQNILRSSTSYSMKTVKVNVPRLLDKGGLFSFGAVTGTLYIPSLNGERPILDAIYSKINSIEDSIELENKRNFVVSTQDSGNLFNLPDNSVDYIFIDPPFGSNIMYSELNFIWESWLRVQTNNTAEAIVNKEQNKDIFDYKNLMKKAFEECFRILKENRWITVEFSNSQSSIWNAIQEAIQNSGLIIANVSVLDKKQGSFKAVTSTTAVKQDLVISAYKPKYENIEKMKHHINTEESAWAFVTQHLEQLPIFSGSKGEAEVIPERTPRILFDRTVAFHVQSGLPVPISSAEFQAGVVQRFPMRDGMVFLENQVAEYDKKRTLVKEFTQLSLFVSDENSAIEWIRQQLMKKPQTRQDIHPNFMKELQHIAKHELLPELDDILNQNFLRYDGEGPVPNQILTYLRRTYKDLRGLEPTDPKVVEKAMHRWYVPDPNKQADLEKLREKALLREYDSYLQELEGNKKKLRTFRTEAIRAGFKKAYSEKDFESIVKVGERIPEKVIQEDDKLLMYYDNACIRLGL